MADYYPLIAKAVVGQSSGEARRVLYDRARAALVAQLRGVDPPLAEADITRERLALDEAIRKCEIGSGPALARRSIGTAASPRCAPRPPQGRAAPPPMGSEEAASGCRRRLRPSGRAGPRPARALIVARSVIPSAVLRSLPRVRQPPRAWSSRRR